MIAGLLLQVTCVVVSILLSLVFTLIIVGVPLVYHELRRERARDSYELQRERACASYALDFSIPEQRRIDARLRRYETLKSKQAPPANAARA